ncbi:MAG: 3-hydroxyacyl-ACP dehydratase FabZ [Trueperaceae bacterium]
MAVDVRAILPHRYPFLLVDAFVSQDGNDFECIKNVSHNEPFFPGHFPGEPVMPGVLVVEALAQAAAVGLAVREGNAVEGSAVEGAVGYLAAIEQAKFRRKVVPGDQLRLTGTIVTFRRGLCKVEARALVGDVVAAEANLSFVYAR